MSRLLPVLETVAAIVAVVLLVYLALRRAGTRFEARKRRRGHHRSAHGTHGSRRH